MGTTDLTGFNCYRLSVQCPNTTTAQSVAGDSATHEHHHEHIFSFNIRSTASEATYNPLLFTAYPDLEYDSFLTIGLTNRQWHPQRWPHC